MNENFTGPHVSFFLLFSYSNRFSTHFQISKPPQISKRDFFEGFDELEDQKEPHRKFEEVDELVNFPLENKNKDFTAIEIGTDQGKHFCKFSLKSADSSSQVKNLHV